MHHVLCGLAANGSLPSELVDRLIAVADADIAVELAQRTDLSRAQAVALAARVEESAVPLAYAGLLTADDVDPATRPDVALALLAECDHLPKASINFSLASSFPVRRVLEM